MKRTLLADVTVVVLWACVSACCFRAYADADNSKTIEFPGLSDGVYLIKRTIFSPPKMFDSKEKADAYLEELKKHPELDTSQPPEDSFYQLHVQAGNFIIHQVERTNQTEYAPKGNFFVSVNGKESWAFEELGNTVTLVTNSPSYSVDDAGPIAGLLKTGQSFCDELKTHGMNVIGSPIVKSKGGADFITGHTKQGLAYNGQIRYDSEGRATNILCSIENPSNPYDLGFDISYQGNTRYIGHTLRTIRNAGQTWRRTAEYTVLDVSAVPILLHMDTFWTGFTNESTRVVVYDPATRQTFFSNRNNATPRNGNPLTTPLHSD